MSKTTKEMMQAGAGVRPVVMAGMLVAIFLGYRALSSKKKSSAVKSTRPSD